MAWSQVGNIRGPQGPAGVGVQYKGNVANAGALPPTGNTNGDMRITLDDGHAHIWEDTQWLDVGLWLGQTGATGPAGAAGARGSLWYSGALTDVELNDTPAPITGERVDDHYLNTSTGNVYRFA